MVVYYVVESQKWLKRKMDWKTAMLDVYVYIPFIGPLIFDHNP